MGAGIDADCRVVDGVGIVYFIDESTVVDAGDSILFDHARIASAASALRLLTRKKGWRDRSAKRPAGMPMPVPCVLMAQLSPIASGRGPHDPSEHQGKQSVQLALNKILNDLRTVAPEDRQAILRRVARRGTEIGMRSPCAGTC